MEVQGYENIAHNFKMERKTFIKMNFIYNAIQDGWTVKKRDDTFVFQKKHEGKKQVFKPDYLETFIETNMKL
jgi:hypothetical protein